MVMVTVAVAIIIKNVLQMFGSGTFYSYALPPAAIGAHPRHGLQPAPAGHHGARRRCACSGCT